MKWVFTYILFYISCVGYAYEVYNSNLNHQPEKDIVKDASEFGAIYNSEKDQSNVVQNAVYECSAKKWKLKISGLLKLTSSVYLPSNTFIFSDNNGGFNYYGSTPYCLLSKEGAKKITVKGLHAFNQAEGMFCFIKCYRSREVIIDSCETNMRVAHIVGMPEGTSYSRAVYSKSRNITVKNCRGASTFFKEGAAAILIEYSTNILVEGNDLSGYRHGIQWWGGDSNPDKDGMPQNSRKCKNIIVRGNTVSNVEAGIWGSMGKNITVENNYVSNCADVGIDFEGCYKATAVNNKVIDAKNGNLATFFMNTNILFKDNAVTTTRQGYAVVKVYNSSLNAEANTNIVFTGNTISCTNNQSGYFYVEPCNFLTLKNNTFNNVCIKTVSINQGNFLIADNQFNMEVNSEIPFFIDISGIYNSRLISIKGNTFTKPGEAFIKGISVASDDFLTNNYISIRTNVFNGFKTNDGPVYIRQNVTEKQIPMMQIDFTDNTEGIELNIEKNRFEPQEKENN